MEERKNVYPIETIVTLLVRRDMMRTRKPDGRRIRQYILSRDTEEAVAVKRLYLNGAIAESECINWCYRWIGSHEFSDEELEYLKDSNYLQLVKAICTKGD